jgi:hypothetical protein
MAEQAREASPAWATAATARSRKKEKAAAKRAERAANTTRVGTGSPGNHRPQAWTRQAQPRSATTKWTCCKCGGTNPRHHRWCNECGTRWNYWDKSDSTPLTRPEATTTGPKDNKDKDSGKTGTPRVAALQAVGATGAARPSGTSTPRADGNLPPSPAPAEPALPNETDLANLEALVAKLRKHTDTASTQMAVHLASQADSLRGALASRAPPPAEEQALPPKNPPPAEILLTRQVRTIAKLQKQTDKHRSAVAAAEEGVLAAQNLLAAQRERLTKAEARLQEAEDTRSNLVAALQKEASTQKAMEVDPPLKGDRAPLAQLDSAVLPLLCTFLGQLLGSSATDDLAKMAAGLRDRLSQHIPDPKSTALALLSAPPPSAPSPSTTTGPGLTMVEEETPAAPALGASSFREAELPPPTKKQASENEKAKVAAPAHKDQPPPAVATTSGDEADEEEEADSDAPRKGRSRSPRDRTTTKLHKRTRDPHEPQSPTPEREEA